MFCEQTNHLLYNYSNYGKKVFKKICTVRIKKNKLLLEIIEGILEDIKSKTYHCLYFMKNLNITRLKNKILNPSNTKLVAEDKRNEMLKV